MGFIQKNAEAEVKAMLGELGEEFGVAAGEVKKVAHETEFMDDGSAISLSLTINRQNNDTSAVLDFSDSSLQTLGNCNAPRVIVKSAVIYSLRCMLKREIPLNQGCLEPITIITKRGSLIDPREDAAVVGGNVLTSQRITDVILKCFRACAASQGCMNNLTFGNERFGYYETICGGAGAGHGWEGASAV